MYQQEHHKKKLFLYHINDLHSSFHQWPKIISYLKQQRAIHEANGEEMILLDIGDHIDRSNAITEASMGKANAQLLDVAGFQYVTLGNNEGLTIAQEDLMAIYNGFSFKVVVCNLKPKEKNNDFIVPYAIHKTSFGDVGIVGATYPYYNAYDQLGFEVLEPVNEIKNAVKQLEKENVSIIILLSHLGEKFDEFIAENIEGINVILGAHTHHHYPIGRKVKDTYLGAAFKYGEFVGKVAIIDKQNMQLETVKVEDYIDDQKTSLLLHDLQLQSNNDLEEKIVYIPRDIKVEWYEDCEAAKLLAESLMEWTNTRAAAIFSGIFLTDLNQGWLTKKKLHEMLPHPINPAVIKLKGIYLKQFFIDASKEEFQKRPMKGLGFRGKVLGHLYLSGFSYKEGNLYILDEPVEDESEYELVVLDLVTFGPLFPYISSHAKITYYLPEMLRDIYRFKLVKEFQV